MADCVVLRPSSADKWVPCPASARLEALLPQEESEEARQGTAVHELINLLATGQISCVEDMVDRRVSNGVFITQESAGCASMYVDFLEENGGLSSWHIEETIRTLSGDPGTPDAWKLSPCGRELTVVDLKSGWGIVEPYENWQLLDYGLSLAEFRPRRPQAFHFVIIQPLAPHPQGRERWWNITDQEIQVYYDELMGAINRARAPDAATRTGTHCQNCRAMRGCPAGREAALAALQVTSQGILEEYNGDEMAVELELLDMAMRAIKNRKGAIEALAAEKIRYGTLVPGWALSQAQGRERWVDPDIVKALGTAYGLQLTKEQAITPAQARKLGVITEGLTTTPDRGHKLVRFDARKKAKEVFGS